MISKPDFLLRWQTSYRETPPINYLFKQRLPGRWARIHSLPAAKRYAETPAEWETLLSRQYTVIDDLTAGQKQALMVINSYTASRPMPGKTPAINLGSFSPDPEAVPVHAHLVTASLDKRSLLPILKRIAGDQLRAFFVGETCLIAPYDGGMDLILESPAACQAFKLKYADWLSERADGL